MIKEDDEGEKELFVVNVIAVAMRHYRTKSYNEAHVILLRDGSHTNDLL